MENVVDVDAILRDLPAGSGCVGCYMLWHAYGAGISWGEFRAACIATGRTVDMLGQPYVEGVDQALVMERVGWLRRATVEVADG